MLEVKPFITELTRYKLSLEHDVSNFDLLSMRNINGPDLKDRLIIVIKCFFPNFSKSLGPHKPVCLRIVKVFVGAGKLELVRDLYVRSRQIVTSRISITDVTDGSGEGPFCTFVKLVLYGVDQELVILAIVIGCYERIKARLHIAIKEVPRVGLMEARHAEDVLRFFTIDEELQG